MTTKIASKTVTKAIGAATKNDTPARQLMTKGQEAKAARATQSPAASLKGMKVAKSEAHPARNSKTATLVELMRQGRGASIEQLVKATGWQKHSVRGAISGQLKKKLGLTVTSTKVDGVRSYRIGR